jgi:hypothetical protein
MTKKKSLRNRNKRGSYVSFFYIKNSSYVEMCILIKGGKNEKEELPGCFMS